ncbi:dihydrofolate reductase [Kribbella aluminosa]|uniref:Dihydrofolate reductase n=1 Tax=Kribbella aluminosa TaxID=416017 RepID=A0ABS4UQS5_9ACTN|nr:dihydrofolate reductase family protein [Kribbella aluminosa]MBP2354001.1 dihydrofolate reductase [Kribbella aluminosa]
MTENKIVVSVQASLDGRVAAEGGALDWLQVKDELHAHFVDVHRTAGMFVYGRNTYDGMAAYWPTAEGAPFLVEYGKVWTAMPKLVFSRTLESAGWNTTVVRDLAVLEEYRRTADGDLYVIGSPQLMTALAERDLVDAYQIYVHPVALGHGPSILEGLPARQGLTLTGARTFDGNVVKLEYTR